MHSDTIAAISTPAGKGGIAVIRVSGPEAIDIVGKIWQGKPLSGVASHTAHFGSVVDEGKELDEAVVTVFRAPRTYTGEDVVEISVHGSVYIQRRLLNLLIENGCRLADPGEFTRRAFSSGRMDLAQAESVADLIASTSKASHRVAMSQMKGNFSKKLSDLRDSLLHLAAMLELELDFSEEDVEFASRKELKDKSAETLTVITRLADTFAAGNAIRNGIPVAIVGDTNAGKSTLLNLLVGDERAIVSEIHGTTRDTIEESIDLSGHSFRLIDTAGLRSTVDEIESVGIARALDKASRARIIMWVLDSSLPLNTATAKELRDKISEDSAVIIISNKTDLGGSTRAPMEHALEYFPDALTIEISAKEESARPKVVEALLTAGDKYLNTDTDVLVTNARHYEALINARTSLQRVEEGLSQQTPIDLIAQDLRETLHHLSTITGQITTPQILSHIFSQFCIGK